MKTSSSLRHLLFFAAALLTLSLPQQVHAQFREWINGGTTNWSTAGNWGGGAYTFAQLEWKGNGTTTSWNDLSSPQSQWRFYFSGSTAYTLGGNAVSFFDNNTTNGGILTDASVTQTINMDLNFADNGTRDMFILTRGTGGLTFGGAVNLTNSMTSLGIGGSNSASLITFNGPITGNKGIIIGTNALNSGGAGMGATRVVFNGSNSYTGTTHVARGSLSITNNNSIGTNDLILGLSGSGLLATLEINNTLTRTNIVSIHDGGINSQISVASGQVFTISTNLINSSGANTATKFGKAGAGTLLLAGTASTYVGQIQIGQGTVIIGSSASLGANISTINRGIDLGLNVNDANQTNNVSLLLSNGVVLSNSIFVSANTISGTNYTRTIGLSGSGSATINNQIFLGGNLTLDAAASGDSLLIVGNITNSGGLIKVGAGTVILSAATTNNYSGGTLVSAGTLQGSASSLQGNITNNAVVRFNPTSAGTFTGVISGNGSVAKAGNFAITLSNGNSYTGGTIIEADSLIAGANGAIGTGVLAFSNATTARLHLNGTTNTVTGLSFAGAGLGIIQNEGGGSSAGRLVLDLASGTANTIATSIIRDGSAAGFGTLALTKTGAGTLDLSVVDSRTAYSGGLTVNAGTVGFGAATNAVGSGAITLGGGALRYTATGSTNRTLANTFSLTPATSSSINVAASTVALSVTNVISGSGALTKTGAGTLALAGNGINTYSGLTTVSEGTLQLNKTAGTTAIAGDLSVGSGATLLISASDQVAGTSDVTLSGGTIQRGDGVSEVFGDINITSASTLDFGSGATGTFQFQAYANAGSSTITVANFNAGNKLQFLGSSFGVGNLAQFNFGSFDYTTGTEGSYFTITAVPEPSTVAAALGLTALLGWPTVRRRFSKSRP